MEILSFKIQGKLAHFRKYYANNTAFSFTIPPRTTLMGIVAAVMGWPKDSYYEDLSSEKIQFGLRVLGTLKKSFHRLNFLKILSIADMSKDFSSDFRGEKGRIQTPFEIVSGLDLVKDEVSFQVFVKATEDGNAVFEKIKNHLQNHNPVFNISLGTANFSASIYDIVLFTENEIKEKHSEEFILMHSVLPIDIVEELKFDKNELAEYNFVEEDMMPGDFVANHKREVRKMNRLLFSTTKHPLRVKLKNSFYQLETGNEILNIQFMDL